MRRLRRVVIATLFAAPLSAAAQALPPHAWLFGSWTGGFFPVEGRIAPAACLAQPVMIFTKDVVLRATLTSQTYVQRIVETARASATGVEFRFTSVPPPPAGSDLLGLNTQSPTGFGCENPDVLHVVRSSNHEIIFQGCNDFPYPLIRCPNAAPEGGEARASRR
ncbi:MAG TPA: hypothetical protein VJY39_06455 [Acidisphaera sp.]|nr:hypothetical protein [Acidisphaera sp.]